MEKVLIVDDEPSIATLLEYHVKQEGYETTIAEDGQTALDLAVTQTFSFILLDVMLPKMDGVEVLKQLRQQKVTTPVILLTAKDDLVDKVIGLEMGADDYITKPFSPREVLARMKAVKRRVSPEEIPVDNQEKVLKVGDICAYPEKFIVTKHDRELNLTKKEFLLLVYFMERTKRIISRETILQQLWPEELYDQTRTVDVHVSHLREKIEDNPKSPQYLKTIRGFGYQFQEPDLHEK